MGKAAVMVIVSVAALGWASVASAQEMLEKTVPAPEKAFELGIGAGFSQGIGNYIAPNGQAISTAGSGGAAELELGYRIDPRFLVGVYGMGSMHGTNGQTTLPGTDRINSAAIGVQGQFHMLPFKAIDPWVSLGTGWRGTWVVPAVGDTLATHGWQIAKLRIGVDYRVSDAVALGPVVGAELNLPLTQAGTGTSTYSNISSDNLRVNSFFYAAIQGRFDFGGDRTTAGGRGVEVASANR